VIIEESFEVPVGKDEAAAFLVDVERMGACVPGLQDIRLVDDQYEATLRLQLGPIRSQFVGHAHVDDSGAPDQLAATAEGRDRTTSSQVQVQFRALLTEHPGPRTTVDCTSDVTIRGRLSQFGTGLITSTAKSVLREFAECAGTTLAMSRDTGLRASAAGSTSDQPATISSPSPSLGRILRRTLRVYVADLWHRLRARRRRSRPADVS
jgi:carbon monoxide dehydrogenase subunit G